MPAGQIRNDIDKLREKFRIGGITNPLVVTEQISYLMSARMLDMQEDTRSGGLAAGAGRYMEVAIAEPRDIKPPAGRSIGRLRRYAAKLPYCIKGV